MNEDTREVFRRTLYEGIVSPPPGFLERSKLKIPLYQGSNQRGLRMLKPDVSGEYGIYLSPSRRYARLYGRYLYEVFVKLLRPLVVENKGEISSSDLTKEDVRKLEAKGWDSIVSTSGTLERATEVVAFRSKQVHILRELT